VTKFPLLLIRILVLALVYAMRKGKGRMSVHETPSEGADQRRSVPEISKPYEAYNSDSRSEAALDLKQSARSDSRKARKTRVKNLLPNPHKTRRQNLVCTLILKGRKFLFATMTMYLKKRGNFFKHLL
jgi:hypothetical protein